MEVKREVVRRIMRETKPDFLTVSNEPLTEERVMGLKELADPRRFVEVFKRMIQSLPQTRKTKIGAGGGSWSLLSSCFVNLTK